MMLSRVACPAILRCDAVTWSPGVRRRRPAGGARTRSGARARAATSILSDSYSFRLRSGARARSRVTAPRPAAAADTSHVSRATHV
jgi:hypothetical protein